MNRSVKNARVLVIGLGVSGCSAARFLLHRGAFVTGVESKLEKLNHDAEIAALKAEGMIPLHDTAPFDVKVFDFVVVSPGVPKEHKLYSEALSHDIPVLGEVELACREIAKFPHKKCVAVTGTNGKTTVTALVEHVLRSCGLKALALGNIGTPVTAALDLAEATDLVDIFVIELSSFQLETLSSHFIDAGVILNITPDHLDRYEGLTEYARAKIQMYNLLRQEGANKPSGVLFVEDRCFREFSSLFENKDVLTYGYDSSCYATIDKGELKVQGSERVSLPKHLQNKHSHEVENLTAAFLLCRHMGVTSDQFLNAYASFSKPPHRIEFVRTVGGVSFYDDSKGTNIDAVIRAVDSLDGQIVLIAGGVDKGAPYTPWLSAFNSKVKGICAIGQAASKITNDLGKHIPVYGCKTLEEAVKHAKEIAEGRGIVLLSPGCSSFDMFKDYAHRGQEFQRVVNAL